MVNRSKTKTASPIVYLLSIEDIVQSPLIHSQVLALLKEMAAQQPDHSWTVVSLYPILNWLRFRHQVSALRADLTNQGIVLHVWPLIFLTRFFYIPWFLLPLYILEAFAFAFWIALRLHPALVHCRSYPAALVGYWIKKLTGAKLVFDTRALYPEEGATLKEGGKSVVLDAVSFAAWKHLEHIMLTTADSITVVSQPSIDILSQEYPLAATRLHVFPTITQVPEWSTLESWRIQTRHELGLSKTWVAAYAGSWFESRPTYDLLVRLLMSQPTVRWHFLFLVSTDAARNAIASLQERLQAELELAQAITVMSVPQTDVLRYLACADIALQPVGTPHVDHVDPRYTLTARTRISVKFTEYLASGLPVLVSRWAGAAADLTRQHSLGLVYDDATSEAFTAWLAQWRTEQDNFRYRTWQFSRENFAVEQIASRYLALYRGEL